MKQLLVLIIMISILYPQNDKFKLNFSERIRIETWDHAIHMGDPSISNPSQNFLRVRTSFGAQYQPNSNIEITTKITNEFRYYMNPTTIDFKMNEIFFDQLYFKYTDNDLIKGTLTIGRQNIILGEGFVIMDGAPLDGSRSIYFNALRYDLNLDPKNKITSFFVYQPMTEDILFTINGKNIEPNFIKNDTYFLLEQIQRAAGIYYSGKMGTTNLDAYYIYKNGTENTKVAELKLHTIGSRVNIPLSPQFNLTAEVAYQTGKNAGFDRSGLGGYGYINYNINNEGSRFIPKMLTAGMFYLSGDDPSTTKIESWDPLFSRWPKWSESYIYSQIREFNGTVAYWSNIYSFYLKAKFELDKGLDLSLDNHFLMADYKPSAGVFPGGKGTNRGNLFIAKLNYKISDYLSGHLLLENFKPGDYYFDNAKSYNWFRTELLFSL